MPEYLNDYGEPIAAAPPPVYLSDVGEPIGPAPLISPAGADRTIVQTPIPLVSPPGEIDRQKAWSLSPARDALAGRMHQPAANVPPDSTPIPAPAPLGRVGMLTGQPAPPLPAHIPVLDAPAEGAQQIGTGLRGLWAGLKARFLAPRTSALGQPMQPPEMNAASDVLEGGFKVLEPAVAGAAVVAPIPTAIGLGSAYVAQRAGQKGAELLGASPEAQRLTGNVSALAAGGLVAHEAIARGSRLLDTVADRGRLLRESRASVEPKFAGRGSTTAALEGRYLNAAGDEMPSGPEPIYLGPDGHEIAAPGPPEPPGAPESAALAPEGKTAPVSDIVSVAPSQPAGAPIPEPVPHAEGPTLSLQELAQRPPAAAPPDAAPAPPPIPQGAVPVSGAQSIAPAPIPATLPEAQHVPEQTSDVGANHGAPPTGETPEGRGASGPDDTRVPEARSAADRETELLTSLTQEAIAGGHAGDPEVLYQHLKERADAMREIKAEVENAGGTPQELLREIAKAGGLGWDTEHTGELAWLWESSDRTRVHGRTLNKKTARPIKSHDRLTGAFGGVRGVLKPKGSGEGLTPDGIVEYLGQDPRFQHIRTINDLFNELYGSIRAGSVRQGYGELTAQELGADGAKWWEKMLPASPDNPHAATVATWSDGDLRAALSEHLQFGRDAALSSNDSALYLKALEQEVARRALPAGTAHEHDIVDTLDTGEEQPRLPGAADVRKPGKAATFDLPVQSSAEFSLEGTPTDEAAAREAADEDAASRRSLFGDDDDEPSGTQSMRAGVNLKRPKPSPIPGVIPGRQLRPSEIVAMLSKSLENLPVRVGKFRQRALGIYKPRARTVRLKVANDLQVLAHEIGHHLDEALVGTVLKNGKRVSVSKSKDPIINKELAGLGAATSLPSYTPGMVRKEGAAEFLRYYLSDPAVLQARAPHYLAEFEQALEQHQDLKAILQFARQQYQGHLAATPKARVLSHIDFHGATEPKGGTDVLTRLETAWVDDLAPLRHAVEALADGQPIDVLEDAYKLARLARGAPAKADGFLRFGPKAADGTSLGPSFQKAIEPVKERLEDFTAYVVAMRVTELKGQRGLETGIDLEDAQAVVKELDSPEFRKARSLVFSYQSGVLHYAQQAGVITARAEHAMLAKNQLYVPFRRIQEALDGWIQGGGAARRVANRAVPIKKYRGSGVDIINPLESIVRNTHAIVDMVEKNKALQALVTQATKTPGGGAFIEAVPPPLEFSKFHLAQASGQIKKALEDAGLNVDVVIDGRGNRQLEVEGAVLDLDEMIKIFTPAQMVKGENGLITVVKNGEREFYQVNNLALYDALTAVGVQSSDLLVNLFMKPARTLRAGATLTVGFLARNPVRDTFTAAVNTRYGFRLGYDTLKGLFTYLKKGDDYQAFLDSGGGNAAMVSFDRNKVREVLHELGIHETRALWRRLAVNPLDLLRALSEAGENATRLGEFTRGLKVEGRTAEGRARAALAARDVTVDFARGGTTSKEINRYTAFFNAGIQGTVRIAEVFQKDPLGATWRALAAIMLPTLALWYLHKDDDEYAELPAWEKLTYWHIPLGQGRGFARVPTPFELFTVFGATPMAALDYLYKRDKAVAQQLFPDADSAWSVLISVMPTAILPVVEAVTNYDTFRKRPIVSPWDLNLDKSEQYNRWTSALAKDVGPKLGLAPAKFDHLVYGYFAGLGRAAVGSVDFVRGELGDRSLSSVRQLPIVGDPVAAFWRPYAGSDAQSIQELYETRDALVGTRSTIARWQAAGKTEQVKARLAIARDEYGSDLDSRYHAVNAAADALGQARKQLDALWASDRLTLDEKRDQQDHIFEQMVNTARVALGKAPLRSRFAKAEKPSPLPTVKAAP